MITLYLFVIILFAGGLVGCFVPVLPGVGLIFIGALLFGMGSQFAVIGPGRLVLLGALATVAYGFDFVAGAIGTRKLGGTKWGVGGSVLGALLGLWFGPFGLIIGPIAGAFIGEAVHTREWRQSLRGGFGALIGMLAGSLAKFALALVMIGLFLMWIVTA